jgi:hypothetical protein
MWSKVGNTEVRGHSVCTSYLTVASTLLLRAFSNLWEYAAFVLFYYHFYSSYLNSCVGYPSTLQRMCVKMWLTRFRMARIPMLRAIYILDLSIHMRGKEY